MLVFPQLIISVVISVVAATSGCTVFNTCATVQYMLYTEHQQVHIHSLQCSVQRTLIGGSTRVIPAS